MTQPWGPQASGGITAPKRQHDGPWWWGFALLSLLVMPAIYVVLAILRQDPCDITIGLAPPDRTGCDTARVDTSSSVTLFETLLTIIWWVTVVVGVPMGIWDAAQNERFARGRWISFLLLVVVQRQAVIAYAGAFLATKLVRWAWRAIRGTHRAVTIPKDPVTSAKATRSVMKSIDPYAALIGTARQASGGSAPGAHLGWDGAGNYLGARPRVAVLVIGPPGSGKTAAQIIPSITIAPYATVASSVRADVLEATVALRRLVGRCWHFDPGGTGTSFPEVTPVRWSPLVGLRSWDDARLKADRLVEAVRKPGTAQGGDGDHFIDRARDWIEVLLYAAALDNQPISTLADWAMRPDSEETQTQVDSILLYHKDIPGADIAANQHLALQEIPDRERGSIKSTMTRILRIYSSTAARQVGHLPNFDPQAFVRSSDTLYITAPSDRQKEYAPLIAGLLQEIRFATYERARREREGLDPALPHVTFALDEANNTAPIPLPEIVSEGGGSKLHVIVGIQDLSRARNRWGREAEGFLTLFGVKIVHPGVVEPYTLDALSAASGEYDRVMTSVSESTGYMPGPIPREVTHMNTSYSTQTRRVLTQGDIAQLPPGTALMFTGAAHQLINIGMYWKHPAWQAVAQFAYHQPPVPRPEPRPISASGAPILHTQPAPSHTVIDGEILSADTQSAEPERREGEQ